MAMFKYTVVNSNGGKIQGTKEAQSKDALLQFLNNQGFTVLSIQENLGFDLNQLGNIELTGMSLKDKVLLSKQLATMIGAGIPLIQAIKIIGDQSETKFIKDKFDEIYKKIEAGSSLSTALEQVGGIFSEVQINLIAAGEKSGNLNEMLEKVAEDLDKSKDLRGKITGAMIYPAIIFVVMIVIMVVMIVFMVPQIEQLYKSLGADEIPLVTRILVGIGGFVSSPFFVISLVLGIAGIIASYRYMVSVPERKMILDKIFLRIPVFGNMLIKIQLAEFCRLTAMLMKSGIPIIESITIVAKAMPNEVFKKIILDSKDDLTKGNTLSIGLAKNNINEAFPTILIRIISTGEESGKLDKVLEDMYKYYNAEVEQITGNLTKLLEPFILVVVGGMVAFLAIAIYLPIYTVGNFIQ
ncbi:type II secretion system F family protein [Candidatus Dojkabacteria bacterium]|uniref:Type II secretion system F family protein n=1 Tax=Candidatus Dojkabacteria bacterium TaxID=2099670 RepID=A0A955L2E1_9BACT|nr:type II secretion system F family protein [Candidatus Dojkabacteria bacterium]